MDFNNLVAAAKGEIVMLREIIIEPIPQHQVEGQQKCNPLRLQFARGMLIIGLICTITGLVMFFTAPLSQKNADRGHQIELLQLENQLKPMPPAEYKRRFEEILKK